MATKQDPDCPCKKQRIMLGTRDGETGEDSTQEHSVLSEVATAMELEGIGPEGDMRNRHIKGQYECSNVLMEPGSSGDGPSHQERQSNEVAFPSGALTENPPVTNPSKVVEQVSNTGRAAGSRLFTDKYSVLQNSTAIAENAFIKSKECDKLSGDRDNFRTDLVKLGPSTSNSTSLLTQGYSGANESEDSNKIIAFDRADFEFDFYGRGTRDEEDGSLISPPDKLNDTGFIEMFSNSVMGSVLNAPGKKNNFVTMASEYSIRNNRPPSTHPSSVFEPVKQPNVPFDLDSKYMNTIVSQQNINSLPQSVLVNIFQSLSPYILLRKAGLVCKYWYNMCRDPDLWREIILRNQYKLTDVALMQLLDFSDRVLKVNLNDCRFVSDFGVHRLVSNCQHIQSLKLMRCFDLTDSSFTGMGSQGWCSTLHTLHLDGCCKLTDNTVVEISQACQNLRSLHLNQCSKITDTGVIALAQHCHSISQLLLDHCGKVTDNGLSDLVLGCPSLTYLNIMSCGVTDNGIKMLSKLQHLTNLDVSNIPLMTPSSIIYVSRYCKKLDCVNISLNSVIDDHCVAELARNLPSLLRLYCVSCCVTDKGLEDIAFHRPTLEALDVGWCQDITDRGVRVISHTCRKLDYFGLIRCDKVTIETIEELVLSYPTVNYSTFILESRRLLERARREGYQFGL